MGLRSFQPPCAPVWMLWNSCFGNGWLRCALVKLRGEKWAGFGVLGQICTVAVQLSLGEGCECGISELCFRCTFMLICFDALIQMKSCFPDSCNVRFNLLWNGCSKCTLGFYSSTRKDLELSGTSRCFKHRVLLNPNTFNLQKNSKMRTSNSRSVSSEN